MNGRPITSPGELDEELSSLLSRVESHSLLYGRTDGPDDPILSVPNDDDQLLVTDVIGEMMSGAYPYSAVIEIDEYQFRNRRIEADNIWEVYAPDGGMVTPALNLGAFRTAEEVETYLLEEVFDSR